MIVAFRVPPVFCKKVAVREPFPLPDGVTVHHTALLVAVHEVLSSPLHRNSNPTLTATNAADFTRLTSAEPTSATFSICSKNNDQHLNDSDITNHMSSNTFLHNVLNNQPNPNNCDISTLNNSDITFKNALNNDNDIINHNSNNPSINNVLNNQNNLNDNDTNYCNSNNISLNNGLNTPTNHTIFLNEYNDELFQPILHREVVSAFS